MSRTARTSTASRPDRKTRARAVESDARWARVVARDPSADGAFVFSVETTGIYCQPACPAGVHYGELLETMSITTNEYTFTDKEGMRGNEKQYGALREMEIVAAPGETISAIEVADHASGSIAGIWKRFRDEKLHQVDVYLLNK